MGNFFTSVEDFFKQVEVTVSTVFIDLFGKTAAQQFGKATIALLNEGVGAIALQTVTALQTTMAGSSSSQKQAAAYEQILSVAKTQGLQVSNSLVNMLIELAVQKIQGTFVATTTTSV